MTKTLEPEKIWSPQYPKSKESRIKMEDCEFQTFVPDRRAGIFVQDQPLLEDPACFWIDYEHVYLRINWSTWGKVSLSSPEQVIAICNTHFCRITLSSDNEVKDYTAPVYRIAELPKDLFCDDDSCDEEEDSSRDHSDGGDSLKHYVDLISDIMKDISEDVEVFPRVKLEDDCASVVISDDNHALIMDILPEDRDFIFTPPNGKDGSGSVDDWSSELVSLDFVEKLRRMQKYLSNMQQNATVEIGFLANTWTIDELQSIMKSEGISDVVLFSYADLKEHLIHLFSPKMNMDHGTIAKRVTEIIIEHMGVEASRVKENALLVDDLGADELDLVEMCMAIEEAFDFFFPDDVFSHFRTVKDIVDFIENHQED